MPSEIIEQDASHDLIAAAQYRFSLLPPAASTDAAGPYDASAPRTAAGLAAAFRRLLCLTDGLRARDVAASPASPPPPLGSVPALEDDAQMSDVPLEEATQEGLSNVRVAVVRSRIVRVRPCTNPVVVL